MAQDRKDMPRTDIGKDEHKPDLGKQGELGKQGGMGEKKEWKPGEKKEWEKKEGEIPSR